ncbi:MAG: B12-binding domain-containing radical SAM protein, partial [Candidatus Omnitrophica bacterium]|nr:B12-binding domain-containing radical SAM protein [Candidatus Omnitrophota bacterium]
METKLKDMLSRVYKPGRYTGGETNSVVKEHGPGKVSIALAYPDMYEIGMSYLGIKILYHLLNERDDVVCERVFAPWPDMEAELRTQGESLFSLETRTPLAKFDVIGFSLSYELTYTNVLNILDLSGIPVRSDTRGEGDPIIIAGGASAYNPEPISPFIDAFLLGDGEEALPAFLEAY